MNFDDTAKFFGPSHVLHPELFLPAAKSKGRPCKECGRGDVYGIRRYCVRCADNRRLRANREARRKYRTVKREKNRRASA